MTAQPRNLLEYYMNQASFERVAAQEQQATVDASRTLKEVKTKDASGRVISTFEGSPRSWMEQFGMNPKRVVAINTK